MKNKGIFLSLIAVAALFFAFYTPVNNEQKEAIIMQSLLTDLNYYHYKPLVIDDKLSEKVYQLFLDRLDGAKRWFTQEDIAKLEVHKNQLDDQANTGTYAFLDLAIQLQNVAMTKTQAYYREFLSQPFKFDQDESFESDGKKRDFAKNDADLKDYWRKAMKWETMTRLSEKVTKKENKDPDFSSKSVEQLEIESREEVLKVYDDFYSRLSKRKRSDFLSTYLNAFTNIFDPHTEYYEPIDKQNFDIGMSGRFEGIGARLTTDGEFTKVAEIIVGGPVWKQGILKENDRIVKVSQEDKEEWTDVTGMVLTDVVQLIRGKRGTKVRLTIRKPDGLVREISVIRDVVIVEEGFAKSLLLDTESKNKIGYIYLPRFYADFNDRDGRFCATDVANEIEKLKQENVEGIVLDLRGNGGGSLRDVVRMSGFFIEQGPIVQVKSRERRPEVLTDDDASVLYNGPLIVMVNQFSASASEILAAALQDYGRAVIVGVGNSTFGKGTVQRFFDLDAVVRGYSEVKPLGEVKLTVQKFFRVNGGATQLKGVTPDIILPDGWLHMEFGEKQEDFPMQWSQIEPVTHSQKVYTIKNLKKIQAQSKSRLAKSEIFPKVYERAELIKNQRDDTFVPLNLQAYRNRKTQWNAQNKQFDELLDKDVVSGAQNLSADLPSFKNDESKKARNDQWIKGVKKDIHLMETLYVMQDLIGVKN